MLLSLSQFVPPKEQSFGDRPHWGSDSEILFYYNYCRENYEEVKDWVLHSQPN